MIAATDITIYWALIGLFASLLAGSVVRLIALRKADEKTRRKRFASLRTWWLLFIAMSAALLTGRFGICLLLAVASGIAWFELGRILDPRPGNRFAIRAGYALIVLNYLLILTGAIPIFVVFIPLGALFVIAIALLIEDEPKGYIRSAGGLLWGMMFLGYGISHAAVLLVHPAAPSTPVGPVGWFLFLVILTEADDIFQALVGRRFGAHKRHRISPLISPNKTWEGFVGGMVAIVIIAPIIAPWITTLGQTAGPLALEESLRAWVAPVLAAILISIAGFFGDINMSAIKRDAGIKDSSKLLPGMGGVIDRVDSLTMTAPVFVYFVIWWTA